MGEWKGVLDAFSFEDGIGDVMVCRWALFVLVLFFSYECLFLFVWCFFFLPSGRIFLTCSLPRGWQLGTFSFL